MRAPWADKHAAHSDTLVGGQVMRAPWADRHVADWRCLAAGWPE